MLGRRIIVGIISKFIRANGTYRASDEGADGYSVVTVDVPNTYTAGDEGKVVQSGALTAQSAITVTLNGTYDTTVNDTVIVSVSGVRPGLPSAYQEVAYLDFTPSVGIFVTIPTIKTIYYVDFSCDTTSGNNAVFAYRESSSQNSDFEFRGKDGVANMWIRSASNGFDISGNKNFSVGERLNLVGVLVPTRSTALVGKYASYNGSSSINSEALDGKMYSIRGMNPITEEPVVWFVPCYRKSDNQVGVYDVIGRAFYYETYAVGSGYGITAGPDVT